MYLHDPSSMRTEYSAGRASRMAKRSRFAWGLTLLLSSLYLIFLLLIASESELLSASNPLSPLIWGLGLMLLITSFVLAGLYFKRASQDFESMNAELRSHPEATAETQPKQDLLMPDPRK
ncbi:DUF485 domain-containing protein [Serpens gallinarum]|uniref:DUF485 domain-containing protein n=1 Tax=Serpens gallinarum TaxID=2763075 RepID=A0ABR8TP96_9PSED|nr:DUF485 domain-containing protein [Serpens gallinarum]MBD7977587.1 DUF485 domain-containing protein [Serpens gallinarum]